MLSKQEPGEELETTMKEFLEVEVFKEVLNVVVKFLKDIKEPLIDIVNSLMSTVKGSELGSDVGAFYKKLIEAGVPEETAAELTKKYLEERLMIFKATRTLFSELIKGRKIEHKKVKELAKEG